jgi:hypothetical protein
VQSSKQRSSLGNKTQGLGTRGSSDADFLQTLQQQQQSGQALEAVFHSQNPPATPAAGADKGAAAAAAAAGAGARGPGARSPHPGTASNVTNVTNGPSFLSPSPGPWFGPSLDTPLPPAPATTPVSLPLPPPGSTPAAAAAAAAAGGGGGGQVAGAALAAAAAAASGVNPLLTNLPSSTKWGSGKGGASSLQRRLSGGAESIPHRLTSIAEVSDSMFDLVSWGRVSSAARLIHVKPGVVLCTRIKLGIFNDSAPGYACASFALAPSLLCRLHSPHTPRCSSCYFC